MEKWILPPGGEWQRVPDQEPSLEQELGLGVWEPKALRAAREEAHNDNDNNEERLGRSYNWMIAAVAAVVTVGIVLYLALPVKLTW